MEINYDLELEKAAEKIIKENAKLVCIQLPDGLKEKATEIAKYLEEITKSTILIWLGSAWGSCDIPVLELDRVYFKIASAITDNIEALFNYQRIARKIKDSEREIKDYFEENKN